MSGLLNRDEARRFYDRFGSKQDDQAFYEDPALDVLVAAGEFDKATSIVELGCGTGRFAERILDSSSARYEGFEISATMASLATRRLARFGDRVAVHEFSGAMPLGLPDKSADRFVSTYVLDLLSDDEISAVLGDAHRLLRTNGLLCLVGITHGPEILSRIVMSAWAGIASFRPGIVGGCRPIRVAPRLNAGQWHVRVHQVVVKLGIASEVIVAERLAS